MMSQKICARSDQARQSRTLYSCCLLLVFLCLIVGQLVQQSDAQAYHFSKGWMPGRKRASMGAMSADNGGSSAALIEAVRRAVYDGERDDPRQSSATAICAFKSQVYRLVVDMIREGFERLDETCDLLASPQSGSSSASSDASHAQYLHRNTNFEKSQTED